ncbi:DUF6452 family protein [Siansivirga zeaxanthinifaciens]|nr:DUF6452 family protein [Siansivirga zeaxanthinifaciens]
MKYIKFIFLIVMAVLVGVNISCERDDICPATTSTTPRLIIDLYDTANQLNRKNVFGLVVVGVDNNTILPGFQITSTNKLLLPLRTDANQTQYRLRKDSKVNDNGTPNDTSDDFIDPNQGNEDIITINYVREEVFVSRACGYKTIFNSITLTIEDDGNNWILARQPLLDNQPLENETTTHFNIFH